MARDETAATVTPVPAGVVQRVAAGLRYAVAGITPGDWFGPSQPLAPQAPASVTGRAFDYPVGYNVLARPRSEEAVSFHQLRALADTYDLLRLIIETRKDQVEKLDWALQQRRGSPTPVDPQQIEALQRFLARPDGEHSWTQWLRLLLEDLLVLDAPALYLRRTAGGQPYALEVIDGSTIKRVLDERGRTPAPPSVAYQQVLKGLPAVDYGADEMLYLPRNPRPHKIYGMSAVEQIVMTVNIALRKQLSVLNYYTEGNTPEALIGVPNDWTPDQISQFQAYWDSLLEGNLAARRHTKFVPGDLKYQPLREPVLKDDFDEWLARVVCFAFSLPPTAFVKQTNRATAETQQETATTEGLVPLQRWVKELMDRLLADYFGAPDLEFMWATTPSLDPLVQAQVNQIYLAAGVKTVAEVREELGIGKDLIDTAKVGKFNFDPSQPRDEDGMWTSEGGSTPPDGSRNADGSTNVTISGETPPIGQGNSSDDASNNSSDTPADYSVADGFFMPPSLLPDLATPKPVSPIPQLSPSFPVPNTMGPRSKFDYPYSRDNLPDGLTDEEKDECEKEWDDAEQKCLEHERKNEIGIPKSWIGRTMDECIRGKVRAKCGGSTDGDLET